MTTNESRNMNIEFDITLDSIELDLTGWLKTLFRENIIRPMTNFAEHVNRKLDDRVTPAIRRPISTWVYSNWTFQDRFCGTRPERRWLP